MSVPRTPRSHGSGKSVPSSSTASATEVSVPIGPRIVELLDLAYRAKRPVLLEGPTGIGKSQIVSQFTRSSGLGVVILDLSLLEPPDLIGLPIIENGRTHYASPSELPTGGRGILMLEELNRAEIPVMQPALQLLSARRLHAYELPPGWSCVAAINPEEGDYQVNRLDPALRSRFLQLSVCADRETWLSWAIRENIHPVIGRVVREHSDAFEHASPRSWTYASELLHSLRPDELGKMELVRVALRGYLSTSWALTVTEALSRTSPTPEVDPEALFGPNGETYLTQMVREFESKKRVDIVAMIASRIRRLFSGEELSGRVGRDGLSLSFLERLLASLPGDLRDQCLESAVESGSAQSLLREMGYDADELLSTYDRSPLRSQVTSWRDEMKLHRVRLVVGALSQRLEHRQETVQGGENHSSLVRPLSALIADAGPLAGNLSRWLSSRGLEVDGAPQA